MSLIIFSVSSFPKPEEGLKELSKGDMSRLIGSYFSEFLSKEDGVLKSWVAFVIRVCCDESCSVTLTILRHLFSAYSERADPLYFHS